MALTIPDYANASFIEQAAPDSVDFDAIVAGFQLYGVIGTGALAVTQRAAGANLSVDVAAGNALVNGAIFVPSATNVAITADATNPRWAMVTLDNTGTVAVTLGTAAASPVMPSVAGKTLLAAVWVPAAAGSILNANIIDKRIVIKSAPATTVQTATAFGVASQVGTSSNFALQDHNHGSPPTPVTSAVAGTGIGVSGATGAVTISNTGATSVAGRTGAVTLAESDIANLTTDLAAKYSASNAPPYPVTSVAGRTGAVALTAADVAAGTFPGANSFSGLQTFNAGLTIPSGQSLITGTRSVVTGTRSTTTNASDTVNLGVFSTTGGAIELRIHAHLAAPAAGSTASVTKVYEFAASATMGTLNTWYKLLPADMSATQATTNDFALEVERTGTSTFTFRFRQITIGVAGTITFTVETLGDTAVTFTPSSTVTAAPTAVTALHPSNPMSLVAGNVGVGTDTPASLLHLYGGPASLLGAPFITMEWPAGGKMIAGIGAASMTDTNSGVDAEIANSTGWVRIGLSGGASMLRISGSDAQINDGGTARSIPRGNKYTPSQSTTNTTLSTTLGTFTTVYTAPSATYFANRPYLLVFAGGYVSASANGGTNTYDGRILSGATVLAVGTTGTSVANGRSQLVIIGFWVPSVDTTVALTVAVAQGVGTVTAASAFNVSGSGYLALQAIDIGTK